MAFWKTKTVESICAPITRIVDELREHAASQRDIQSEHAEAVVKHTGLQEAAGAQALTASIRANKIAGLVG